LLSDSLLWCSLFGGGRLLLDRYLTLSLLVVVGSFIKSTRSTRCTISTTELLEQSLDAGLNVLGILYTGTSSNLIVVDLGTVSTSASSRTSGSKAT
jgi:hypothetical protein